MADPRVLSLLGRWHQWRRAWPMERGFAHVVFPSGRDDEDDLERLTMQTIELEIDALAPVDRLALSHVARAECLGVEVVMSTRLGNDAQRTNAIEHALRRIEKRLLRAGIL